MGAKLLTGGENGVEFHQKTIGTIYSMIVRNLYAQSSIGKRESRGQGKGQDQVWGWGPLFHEIAPYLIFSLTFQNSNIESTFVEIGQSLQLFMFGSNPFNIFGFHSPDYPGYLWLVLANSQAVLTKE